jgi:hypothetical protein
MTCQEMSRAVWFVLFVVSSLVYCFMIDTLMNCAHRTEKVFKVILVQQKGPQHEVQITYGTSELVIQAPHFSPEIHFHLSTTTVQ